jgi:hypothetical protein
LSLRIAIVNAARCASAVFPATNSERTLASASCAAAHASSAPARFRSAPVGGSTPSYDASRRDIAGCIATPIACLTRPPTPPSLRDDEAATPHRVRHREGGGKTEATAWCSPILTKGPVGAPF